MRCISELSEVVGEADIIAAVLPLELMAGLLEISCGKPVLQSLSERLDDGVGEDGERRFSFKHIRWRRLKRIEVEFEEP